MLRMIPEGQEVREAYNQVCGLEFNKVGLIEDPHPTLLVGPRMQTNMSLSSKFGIALYLSVDPSLALGLLA